MRLDQFIDMVGVMVLNFFLFFIMTLCNSLLYHVFDMGICSLEYSWSKSVKWGGLFLNVWLAFVLCCKGCINPHEFYVEKTAIQELKDAFFMVLSLASGIFGIVCVCCSVEAELSKELRSLGVSVGFSGADCKLLDSMHPDTLAKLSW